ncbi:FGGY-family carbohydrate kinase [Lacticaseibacillus sp. N501-2]|uniref:FGGY-family carbohydrate kinase n=1 Tax=Lacticaseibacillus salsurae TaxID=3367729 RepID=UPI0038B36167
MAYLIGLDQSTQSTKAFLYDEDATIVAHAALPHHQLISEQGWISHELTEIYNNVQAVVKALFADGTRDPRKVVGVGITNQRETAAAWSRGSGEPLSQAVVWQCTRAKPQCERIATESPGADALIKERTGLPLSPSFTAAKFTWMLENVPAVSAAATANNLCLGTIDAWLLFKLTHGAAFKTEPSNASRTTLMDLDSCQWDQELLDLFSIPKRALPEIVDSDSVFGMTDFEGILPQAVPIHAMLGDSQAALFGQSGFETGSLKATYGTGSSIMINAGTTRVNSASGLVTSIGWQTHGQSTYVLEGNVNYAGALITWLKDSLHLIESADETEVLAKAASSDDHTMIVPAFTGLGAPYWAGDAHAAILNMTAATKRPEIVKAALDAIALQINAVIAAGQDDVTSAFDTLMVDGGPTHNPYLMQRQSDLSQLTLKVADQADISAFGTVLMAGLSLQFLEPNRSYLNYQRYSPELDEVARKRVLEDWQHAVDTVVHHA